MKDEEREPELEAPPPPPEPPIDEPPPELTTVTAMPIVGFDSSLLPLPEPPTAEAEVAAQPIVVAVSPLVDPDQPRPKKKRRTPGVKVPRWSEEEEVKLRTLVQEHGTKDWAKVATELGSHRSPAGVDQHWQILSGKRRRNGKAAHTDRVIVAAEAITNADAVAVAGMPVAVTSIGAPAPAKPAKRDRRSKGKVARWTADEEERLRGLVGDLTDINWDEIAQKLGTGRSGAGVDQHYQIMTGKRKSYYVSVAEKRAMAENSVAAPIAVATVQIADATAVAANNAPEATAMAISEAATEGTAEATAEATVEATTDPAVTAEATITADVQADMPPDATPTVAV
eukprot:scaffold137339_cov33-Tisochrysis_lutea.AAC.3